MKKSHVVSPRTLLVFVLVVALSVGGFVLVKNGISRQNQALLQSDTAQVELLLQSSLQDLEIQLRSVAYFTVSAGKSPQVFAEQTKTLAAPPGTSLALVDISSPTPKVILAVGDGLHAGLPLPFPLSDLTAHATATLSSSILHQGTDSVLALAAAPAVYPHIVCLETTLLHPDKPVPNTSAAYSHIYVNVYASPHGDPSQLIASTFGPGRLPAPVANVVLRLGSIRWLVSAAQKEPLSGAYATATPWIALGVGLVVALALALVFELLARRQRHTERVVVERTAELLAAQADLVRSERLAALGEFATVVGHELRNPLGAAINDLFLLRATAGEHLGADSEMHISRAEGQIYRAAKLSEDLTVYMREREPAFTDIDFAAMIAQVLEITPPPAGIDVSVGSSAALVGDPSLMTQVMTNLVTNAYQAMPNGGRLELAADSDGDTTSITVRDTGTGIDPAVADRLFDPFFTSKAEGTGLGLAIVQRLVALQRGDVSIINAPGTGALVTIRIPHGERASA